MMESSSLGTLSIGLGSLLIAFAIYFLPAVIAATRMHPSNVGIFLLNLLLGWTLLGWVVALIWASSATGRVTSNGPREGERSCPFCAEPIKQAANICKHCGRDVRTEPGTA